MGGVPLVCAVFISREVTGYAKDLCKNLGIPLVVVGDGPGEMSPSGAVELVKTGLIHEVERRLRVQMDVQGL